MTKTSSLAGKLIDKVTSSGSYVTLHLAKPINLGGKKAGQITIDVARMFDKDGNLFEADAPAQ